jgi:tetratricopeptide (TPR) repeat protein
VPPLDAPAVATDAPHRFQRRRCRVSAATLAVDDSGLQALAWSLGPGLGGVGLDEVRLRVLEGAIEVSARVRVGERGAAVTARAYVAEEAGPGLRVALGDVHVFGYLARPTPLVAHDLLGALAPAADPPTVRGLADVDLHPLEALLWTTMPPAGWRIPDSSAARLAGVRVGRGRVEVRFADDGRVDRRARPPIFAALELVRAGDHKLLAGDLDGAAAAYRAELARSGAEAPFVVDRLLGLLVGRAETLREAEQVAREALVRWPGFVPAHLTLGAVGIERGRTLEAAEHYGRVVEIAEEAGDDEDAVRAAVTAARLLRPLDPAGATPYYARVLERRPAHAEAAEALVERYSAEERWSDLVRVAQRRIAASADSVERAREHVRLGEIYLLRLGDAARARRELEQATQLEAADPRAWDALGRALAGLGDPAGALRALERQVELHAAKGDAVGEARTHGRIAALLESTGDVDGADARYRRALALAPGDDDLLEHVARLAARRGRTDEAVAIFERLAGLAPPATGQRPTAGAPPGDDQRRRRVARELARALLGGGDVDRARAQLEAATGGTDAEEAERLELCADVAERAEDRDAAAAALARAAALELPAARAAALELRRARLCQALGRDADADAARARAFELAPDSAAAEAADALAASARARGDADAEARWLDVLLRLPPGAGFEALALRRAELALQGGRPQDCLAFLDAAESHAGSARRLRAEALAASGNAAASARVYDGLAAETADATAAAELLLRAAQTLLAAPDPAAALARAHAALARGPAAEVEEALRLAAGEAAWQLRAWDEVIAAYAPLPRRSVDVARRLGMALERSGRDGEALPVYRAAVGDADARGEALAIAWRRLAELYERQADFAAAAETLATAAGDERTGESPAARAEAHRRAAELLRRRLGATDRAVAELEAALRLMPEHMPSLDALESIAEESGDAERIAVLLGRKVAATAKLPERQKAVLARLADVQHQLGRPEAALEAYRRALAIDAELRPALAYVAAEARARGDRAGAETLYRRLVAGPAPEGEAEIDDRVDAWMALGELAETDEEAEEALAEARRLAPGRDDVLGALETLYRNASRWGEAADAAAARAALAADDETFVARACAHIALLRDAVVDVEAARAAARAAVGRIPDSVRLLRELAVCAEVAGDVHEVGAIEAHIAALAERPPAPAPVEERAVALGSSGERALERGAYAEAAAHFRAALEVLESRRPAGAPHAPERTGFLIALEAALRGASEWEQLVEQLLVRARDVGDTAERLPLLREAAALLADRLGQPDEAADVLAEIARIERGAERRSARRARPARAAQREARPAEADGAAVVPDAAAERRAALRDAEDWPGLVAALERDAAAAAPDLRAVLLGEAARVLAGAMADPAGALIRLDEALRDAGADDAVLGRLLAERAELRARLGDVGGARTDVEQALRTVSPTAHAHLALGRVHLADGRPDAALPYLAAAAAHEELEPALIAEANLLAGHAHEALGQTDAAMVRYEQASAALPYDPRPLDALAALGEARGDHDLLAELIGRRILLSRSARDRARLWLKRARLYRDVLDREPETYRCLKEAYANDPDDLQATQMLHGAAAARGEWALVAELLYREIDAAATAADKARLHEELAAIYEERLLDIDGAIRNYESALELQPSAAQPPGALARLYALLCRPAEAARAEERAAALEPDGAPRAERLLRAGDHHEQAHRLDEAVRLYEAAAAVPGGGDAAAAARAKAARLAEKARDPLQLRAELLERARKVDDNEQRLALLRQLLQLAVDLDDPADIDARSREVLARDPTDSGAFIARRALLTARNDWVGIADLHRGRADSLDDPGERASLYYELGRIAAQRLSDPARAALAFEQALALDSGHTAALDSLADMAYRQHDWERAYGLYGRLDPDASFLGQDVVHYRRGELAEMLGHEDEAEAAYHAAVAANPQHLSALEAIARLALYRGEVTAAIAALKAVLELLPLDDVDRITASRQQLGELCQRAGDNAAARSYFELVLVEDPNRISVLTPLAELYAAAEMWHAATQTLARLSCLIVAPEQRADILFRMGEIFRLQLGDADRASDAYLKAIDLDPQHIATMRRLVEYYWTQTDDAGIGDMAAELEVRGELLAADTASETIAQVAVSRALAGDADWGQQLAATLGDGGAGALATVLADAASRRPESLDATASVARSLCRVPGPSLDAVATVLSVRAEKDPDAARLLDLLVT